MFWMFTNVIRNLNTSFAKVAVEFRCRLKLIDNS